MNDDVTRGAVAALGAAAALSSCGGLLEGVTGGGSDTPVLADGSDDSAARDATFNDGADADEASASAFDGNPTDVPFDQDAASPIADAEDCPPSTTHVDGGGCVPSDPSSGLPSTAPCLAGGNVLSITTEADSCIYTGDLLLTDGMWGTSVQYEGQLW
jgi:hypothetical protein